MKKILNYISNLFKSLFKTKNKESVAANTNTNPKVTVKNINWKLINELESHDIVFVKMPEQVIEDLNIENPHQRRPFLIEEKNDIEEMLFGYYFTSNIMSNYVFKKEKYEGLKIILKKEECGLLKNSLLLYTDRISLSYENVIYKIGSANSRVLSLLYKYKSLLNNEIVISTRDNKVIEIGDIIDCGNNELYIIYQMDNTNCYGYYIKPSNENVDIQENPNYIVFDNILYFIDYKKNRVFNNNDTLHIIKRFNEQVVELIRENKKKIKYGRKQQEKRRNEMIPQNTMNYYELNHEATMEDLLNFNYPNQKLGVIVHIEDSEGKILLQKRGIKSRDENGLYEDVGGKLEESDINFKEAIIRELKEEVGDEAIFEISDSIGIYHCYKNNINWIFIIYFGKYINGQLKIMEPDKCIGYKFFTYEDVIDSTFVSKSCKYLAKKIKLSQK